MSDLFEEVVSLPSAEARAAYASLVGLDDFKERLEKEAEVLLRPDLLEAWSETHHKGRLPALDLLEQRPHLFIFAGDVGTGKTALATSFGDQLARSTRTDVELFILSIRARGTGIVGQMTGLISDAFAQLKDRFSSQAGKKASRAGILLIDEADSLAQSREMTQMHHEDRAGVNALIRGIDDISKARLPCLTVMCTNRVDALDPAIKRRAAAIFEFTRPSPEARVKMLGDYLSASGLTKKEIETLAERMGAPAEKDVPFTFSDITQRFLPALVLAAYPKESITLEKALTVLAHLRATPAFRG